MEYTIIPDGTYITNDGRKIVIVDGLIVDVFEPPDQT
jgi:hypothetical protein